MEVMDRIVLFSEIYKDDDKEELMKCAPNWNELFDLKILLIKL